MPSPTLNRLGVPEVTRGGLQSRWRVLSDPDILDVSSERPCLVASRRSRQTNRTGRFSLSAANSGSIVRHDVAMSATRKADARSGRTTDAQLRTFGVDAQ